MRSIFGFFVSIILVCIGFFLIVEARADVFMPNDRVDSSVLRPSVTKANGSFVVTVRNTDTKAIYEFALENEDFEKVDLSGWRFNRTRLGRSEFANYPKMKTRRVVLPNTGDGNLQLSVSIKEPGDYYFCWVRIEVETAVRGMCRAIRY